MKTLFLAPLLLVACAVDMPVGAPSPDSGPPMCAGYLVTSKCPGAPLVSGYPAIGCHDDAGKFADGCLYNAGPAGRETTSLCVAVCPPAPPPPVCPAVLADGTCNWPTCPSTVTWDFCPSGAPLYGQPVAACHDADGRPVGGCIFVNGGGNGDGSTQIDVCSLACS